MDTFKTVYKGDFLWPYIAPFKAKPYQPPHDTLPKGAYENPKSSAVGKELCQCERHSWSPHYQRAQYLLEKEKAFREAMISVAQQRTILENEIIEHPCLDAADVLASLYQLNYSKRASPLVGYRAMEADHDDPVINPVAMLRTGLSSGYRDPTSFRLRAIENPEIGAAEPVNFIRVPPSVQFPMQTEYEDTISRTGNATIKAVQQFKEPLPSSRRRY